MAELSIDYISERPMETAANLEPPLHTSARDYLWYFWAWQPCTFRGFLAIILSTAAVRTLAIAEFDLVASILGWSILFLSGVTFLCVVILRFRLSGRLDATAHFAGSAVLSGTAVQGGIALRNSSLPPFVSLEIRRLFAHPGVDGPTHIVSGYHPPDSPRLLVDAVTFPHRGLWELRWLECRISDALGFCALRWRLPLHYRIQVSAPDIPIVPLPIIASSHRSGEDLSTATERSGDLFDIKAYDPSDGIKRILWKTYARSGELVARRPEPASIPDGELAIFLIASRTDDAVAGALQDYLEQLRHADIEVLFGTDLHASQGGAAGYLTSRAQIQKAIDGDVWHPAAGTGKGLTAFLEALEARGRSLDQVVLFVSAANERWIDEVTRAVARIPTRVVVAAVDVEQLAELGFLGSLSQEAASQSARLDSLTQRLKGSAFELVPVRASIRQY